jgi:hypothetical protein
LTPELVIFAFSLVPGAAAGDALMANEG